MTKEQIAEAIAIAAEKIKRSINKKLALLYLDWLEEIPGLQNPRCIIYAGLWCEYSQLLVSNFLTKAQEHGKDINSLQEVYWLFHNDFAAEIIMHDKKEEFEHFSRRLLDVVGNMDLSEYGVPAYAKEDEWI